MIFSNVLEIFMLLCSSAIFYCDLLRPARLSLEIAEKVANLQLWSGDLQEFISSVREVPPEKMLLWRADSWALPPNAPSSPAQQAPVADL